MMASAAPEGVGNLDRYSIEWSMRTDGADTYLLARTEVKGKLVFSVEPDNGDAETEVEVGSITATQYRMHHICNTCGGIQRMFGLFDETQEGMDLYVAVVKSWEDGFAEEMQGDLQLINRMVVDPAHRGHGLGLFMLEAADVVVNGHMSAQIMKPFPLQFEAHSHYNNYGRNNYGFPEPPGKTHPAREAAFADADAGLSR